MANLAAGLPRYLSGLQAEQGTEHGGLSLKMDVLGEKYQWLQRETRDTMTWDPVKLTLFQKTYSHKNRYVNRLPYDHNRVRLDVNKNPDKCDYINASVMNFEVENKLTYIAAQAPIPRTFEDFWQMISEQRVQLIVMVVLADGLRCDRYWPEREKELQFQQTGIHVKYNGTKKHKSSIAVKEFTITDEHGSRPLRLYNFLAWPDHGVPDGTGPLMKLFQYLSEDPLYKSPVLVHCSAGVGRTGTFIAIDTLLRLQRENHKFLEESNDPIGEMILAYRRQRSKEAIQPGMSGVFVTCFRNVEAKCTNELYFLLSQACESLGIKEEDGEEEQLGGKDQEEDSSAPKQLSFEDQIKSEVGQLKKRGGKAFVAVEMKNLQCIVFVKAKKGIDVNLVIDRLFSLIHERSIKSIKFCQRVLPIKQICLAKIDEIRHEIGQLIPEYFPAGGPPTEYCVAFESRLNETLDRMTVINMVVEMIGHRHKVNLTSPKKVIVIQVFKAHCGVAVITNWLENRKYNVQETLKTVLSKAE